MRVLLERDGAGKRRLLSGYGGVRGKGMEMGILGKISCVFDFRPGA